MSRDISTPSRCVEARYETSYPREVACEPRFGELDHVPMDYAGCLDKLGETGIIDEGLAARLAQMARFRNRLVHVYWDTDFRQVYRIIRDDLNDLESFVVAVEKLL